MAHGAVKRCNSLSLPASGAAVQRAELQNFAIKILAGKFLY